MKKNFFPLNEQNRKKKILGHAILRGSDRKKMAYNRAGASGLYSQWQERAKGLSDRLEKKKTKRKTTQQNNVK